GNTRLALLAIAHATTGPDALARVGTADLARRLNASKGAAVEAVRRAVDSGELEVAEPAAGSRAALYRIPGAVDYTAGSGPDSRPLNADSGPDSRPVRDTGPALRSGNPTATDLRSGNPTATGPDSGPDSRPLALWDEHPEKCATRARASFKTNECMSEGGERARGNVAVIPEGARPIVDQITAAGVVVAWTLTTAEWFIVDALARRSGPDRPAAAAVRAARRARNGVSHARYFLRTWQALPPAPAEGTVPAAPTGPGADVIPLDPTAPRKGRAAQAADWYAEIIAKEQ